MAEKHGKEVKHYQLCYAEDHFLYFTSDMAKTVGDDWDDAPWIDNADAPRLTKTAIEGANIVILAVDLAVDQLTQQKSLNEINDLGLRMAEYPSWNVSYKAYFHGGDTLQTVRRKIHKAGGMCGLLR